MKKAFSLVILLMAAPSLWALELDDKFLATIMGVSETKKTIMINKGREHGVKKDLHAKFSLPSGVIARGIAVRVSPSRSIWSLYRLWKKDKIEKQISVLLKISEPVKLTSDESRSLGKLAEKVDKKVDKINIEQDEFKKKQKAIKKSMFVKEKRTSVYSEEDFSSLEESMKPKSLDKGIDWSALDGKKDTEEFDRDQDYTTLN